MNGLELSAHYLNESSLQIYETLREDIIGRDADGGFSLGKGVLAGMCTGAIAQFGASPCDLVKVLPAWGARCIKVRLGLG